MQTPQHTSRHVAGRCRGAIHLARLPPFVPPYKGCPWFVFAVWLRYCWTLTSTSPRGGWRKHARHLRPHGRHARPLPRIMSCTHCHSAELSSSALAASQISVTCISLATSIPLTLHTGGASGAVWALAAAHGPAGSVGRSLAGGANGARPAQQPRVLWAGPRYIRWVSQAGTSAVHARARGARCT